jgi:hypothetical protein
MVDTEAVKPRSFASRLVISLEAREIIRWSRCRNINVYWDTEAMIEFYKDSDTSVSPRNCVASSGNRFRVTDMSTHAFSWTILAPYSVHAILRRFERKSFPVMPFVEAVLQS